MFEEWVVSPRLMFRDQEGQDAREELLRLQHWLRLLIFRHLSEERDVQLPERVEGRLKDAILFMEGGLVYEKSRQESTKKLLEELQDLVPESGLGISDKERVMILEAMNLAQGHWYKCPRGHVYAIGDCGGAQQESRCPECKSTIGGQHYRLATGNAVATEMDGAQEAAWSDRNNIHNYGFDVLFED